MVIDEASSPSAPMRRDVKEPGGASAPRRRRRVDRRQPFYPVVTGLIAIVVAIGFGPNIAPKLLHPPVRPPTILYVHTAVFTGWILLLAAQVMLIQRRSYRWHRRLGWAGVVLGAILPVVGIATAIVMGRLALAKGDQDAPAFLVVSFNDMITFAVAFGLSIRWRKSTQIHRRLVLMASAALTVAAFARWPAFLVPDPYWYVGVDLIVALGVMRDLVVTGRAHKTYAVAWPMMIVGQLASMTIYLTRWPVWTGVARWILR